MIFFSLSSSTVGRKLSLRNKYLFFSSFCFFSSAGDWPTNQIETACYKKYVRLHFLYKKRLRTLFIDSVEWDTTISCWYVDSKVSDVCVLFNMFLSTNSSAVGRMDRRRISRAPIASHDSCRSCSLCTTSIFLRTTTKHSKTHHSLSHSTLT